jgi:predicted transcriptional regulator
VQLSPRERQIVDVVYQDGEATAEEIRRSIPDPPSNSAVRATLRTLEEKDVLAHRKAGRRYVYYPAVPPEQVQRSTLEHLKETLFRGSLTKAVATLLSVSDDELSEDELDELSALIERARQQQDESKDSSVE